VQALLVLAAALAFLMVPWAIIALCLTHVANALAVRWQAPALAATVQVGTALVTLLILATGALIAFGTVANADAASKATMLARGILELTKCTAYFVPLAALTIGCGTWLSGALAATGAAQARGPDDERMATAA